MFLDFKLDFQEHCKSLLRNVSNVVALLRKLQNVLPRSALLTICVLLGLISFMTIQFMIELLTTFFTKKLDHYNITQL